MAFLTVVSKDPSAYPWAFRYISRCCVVVKSLISKFSCLVAGKSAQRGQAEQLLTKSKQKKQISRPLLVFETLDVVVRRVSSTIHSLSIQTFTGVTQHTKFGCPF